MLVPDHIEAYALASTTPATPRMEALEVAARSELPFPEMLSGLVEGRLLQLLVWISGAREVLELGTYAGYSALSMAAALGSRGRVVTCEVDPERAAWARRHMDEHPEGDRIRIEVGPGIDTVRRLPGPWDLVFIDAEKEGYPAYVDAVLPKLAPRGVIVLDNTLRYGRVLEPHTDDEGARVLAGLNERLASDPGLVTTMLTIRDGVTLVRRAS